MGFNCTVDISAKDKFKAGVHGYDNQDPSMGTIFIASGPAFKKNYTATPFENVDLYPIVSHVVGLAEPGTTATRPINGSMAAVRQLFRVPSAAAPPPSGHRSQGILAAVFLHATVATVIQCL